MSFIETAFAQVARDISANSLTSAGGTAGEETAGGLMDLIGGIWAKAPFWIAGIIVIIASFYIARIIRKMVVDRIAEHLDDEHQDVLILSGRATYVGVLILGFSIGLGIAGINITAIVAAFGFGIGFAMQDLIMNFIAGVMILIAHHYQIGDYIKVNDTIGQIVEIQSRATILKALDGTKVVVPNSQLFTKQVTSFTSNPFRRIEVPVGVEYDTDLQIAKDVSLQVIRDNVDIAREPEPVVLLDEFDDSSINLLLRFWVDSKSHWLNTRSQIIIDLKKAFDKAGIIIPFPIRTLVVDNKEDQQLSEAIGQSFEKKDKPGKVDAPAPKATAATPAKPVVAEPTKSAPQAKKPASPETHPQASPPPNLDKTLKPPQAASSKPDQKPTEKPAVPSAGSLKISSLPPEKDTPGASSLEKAPAPEKIAPPADATPEPVAKLHVANHTALDDLKAPDSEAETSPASKNVSVESSSVFQKPIPDESHTEAAKSKPTKTEPAPSKPPESKTEPAKTEKNEAKVSSTTPSALDSLGTTTEKPVIPTPPSA